MRKSVTKKYKMHVISGTHWDREWRYTVEQSKLRLTDLIDTLLEILEQKTEYKYFLLDGGTIILEDYLSIRPENEERIKKLIKEKRISLVNWYTLPDMFTVAPEALVRNILIGQKIGHEFGGCMETGYTATSYGQIAQLPQIYRDFGIESIYFYRGLNKHVVPPCFLWESPDGSRILAIRGFDYVTRTNWFFYVHQPLVLGKDPIDMTYKFNSQELPVHFADEYSYEQDFQILKEDIDFNHDKEALKKVLNGIFKYTSWQSIDSHLLALNLEDNQRPYILLPEMIAELNKVSENVEIVQNNWDNFIKEIEKDIPEKSLKIAKGEMRHTAVEPRYNGLLGAVLSSRINLKLLNDKAETELIYLAEPSATIASLLGWNYPYINLFQAWKALLQNHSHDSICGAAVDQAHKDMLYRFSHVQTVAREITRLAFQNIWQNIDFTVFDYNDITLTIFNNLPHKRKEVITAIVDLPKDRDIKYFDLIDLNGNKIPYEKLYGEDIQIRVERELDTSIKFNAQRVRIFFDAEIPSFGYTSFALRKRGPVYEANPKPGYNRNLIALPDGVLENEYLKVTINPNGVLTVTDKINLVTYNNFHFFTDNGETGNAHLTRTPLRDFTVTSLGCNARITLTLNTLFQATFKVELDMKIPREATFDGKDRVKEIISLPITYWLTLKKDSKSIEFRTKVINNSRDHKLRVLFPTDIDTDFSYSESPFMIEKRTILRKDTKDNNEEYFPYQPMQNFACITDERRGITFFSEGLREFEVIDDDKRTLAVTLIRAHRTYMTANEIMMPEELEKYKGSHQIQEMEYNYTLYFHNGNWEKGEVLKQAYLHKVPVRIMQGVKNKGTLPPEHSFFEIMPENKVVLSALKKSENGKGILLRLWNPYKRPLDIKIKTSFSFTRARRVTLNEKNKEKLRLDGNTLELRFKRHEIVSLILE